jgi:hypothetical protein
LSEYGVSDSLEHPLDRCSLENQDEHYQDIEPVEYEHRQRRSYYAGD